MADTITIRPFEEPDLEPTLSTLRAALGETALLRRTPEWFAWKHFTNPFGRSLLVVAEAGDRIVGLRAFMRWRMITPGGEELQCVRAVDTATHPDYLRQGIFRRLTLAALDLAADDGVDLVFNTPNPQSGAGYLKMGWVEVGPIGVMLHPTWRMARGRTSSDRLPDPDRVIPGARPAAGFDVVDRPARGLRTPRRPEYLAWRFDQHPTAAYRRVDAETSSAVVRPNLRNGRIELVVSDVYGPNARAALSEARRRSNAAYLVGWFSRGTEERTAARKAGLIPVPRVRALTLVARPLRDLPIDVTKLDSWDLAMSDLELL